MGKTQPIEQWMTDAAKEWFGDDIEFATKLRRTIACHYHASRAACIALIRAKRAH